MKIKQILAGVLTLSLIVVMTGCKTADKVEDEIQEGADNVKENVEDAVDNNNKNDDVKIDVTLTVEAKDIVGSEYAADFEEDVLTDEGTILSQTKYTVDDGTTVQDLIKEAMDENKIPYSFKGAEQESVIEGIRGIMGGMAGETSGWIYSVNGERMVGTMYDYKLKDGDDVKVFYTLDDVKSEVVNNNDSETGTTDTKDTNNA